MRARECSCKYWKKEIPIMLGAMECADLVSKGIFKTKEITWFEYCPWCGSKLVEAGDELPEVTLDKDFMPRKQVVNLVE